MSDPRLVDIERGGESTQYESILEYTVPPRKETGQLGGDSPHTTSELRTGVPTAENDNGNKEEERLAHNLEKGATTEVKKDSGYDTQGDAEAAKIRRQQGYGPGSGVGA